MFKTASGVSIPFIEEIEEKYMISENQIMLNISFEKLGAFVFDFISVLPEPLFLIVQKPLDEKHKPSSFKKGPLKAELLYFDLQTKAQINEVLDLYGEIFLNDGMSQFGIKSHKSEDEIFIAKYKTVYIFSNEPEKFKPMLEKFGIEQTKDLTIALDLISPDYPGKRSRVVIDKKDIFDVVDLLKEVSPKFASQVVDD